MTTWFTSDTHFGSQRTLELSRRPFGSTDEMDAFILHKWDKMLKEGDTLYHLGDFGEFEQGMSLLKSKKVTCNLVLGNYEEDAIASGKLTKQDLLDMGFASAHHQLHIPELNGALAVHCPLECDKESFNIFGHIHGRQLVKRYGLDVGVDGHHYMPITAEDVLWYKNAIENHYDANVFE